MLIDLQHPLVHGEPCSAPPATTAVGTSAPAFLASSIPREPIGVLARVEASLPHTAQYSPVPLRSNSRSVGNSKPSS
jgi:hypothetical protein